MKHPQAHPLPLRTEKHFWRKCVYLQSGLHIANMCNRTRNNRNKTHERVNSKIHFIQITNIHPSLLKLLFFFKFSKKWFSRLVMNLHCNKRLIKGCYLKTNNQHIRIMSFANLMKRTDRYNKRLQNQKFDRNKIYNYDWIFGGQDRPSLLTPLENFILLNI